MIDNNGTGALWIRGSLESCSKKDNNKQQQQQKYFKLSLSSDVSLSDFHMGYCMSGVMEQSGEKYSPYKITHLAFVKRSSPSSTTTESHNNKKNNNNQHTYVNKKKSISWLKWPLKCGQHQNLYPHILNGGLIRAWCKNYMIVP